MMPKTIYLDYNATTPLDPRVYEAMKPFLGEVFGNPSSISHSYGWESKAAIDKARTQVATSLSGKPNDIVWTSGATESNNMALLGLFRPLLKQKTPCHLVTTLLEHKAILDVAKALEKEGVQVTFLKPNAAGEITPSQVESAITPQTKLVSVMAAQNEIGTINDISEIGAVCRRKNVLFHTDAAQAFGKTAIHVEKMNIDLLSGSGHKIYGPKGIGFLYIKDRTKQNLEPLFFGGSQEHGQRPGTLNVPGVVGMGAAAEIAMKELSEENLRQSELRDHFISRILKAAPEAMLNGHPSMRLSGNISLSFKGLNSDIFALGLSGLALSTASACMAGAPSHVLSAIGHTPQLANATIRIGFGRFTKPEDLEIALKKIIAMVEKNRALGAEIQ